MRSKRLILVIAATLVLNICRAGWSATNTVSAPASGGTLSIGAFARKNGYTAKYYATGGWADLGRNGRTVRIYFAMPYLVSGDAVYYLREPVTLGPSGEALLSPEIMNLASRILNAPVSSFSTSSRSSAASSARSTPGAGSSSVASVPAAVSGTNRSAYEPITAIVIDPGHGGKDPGGLGVNGIKEKEVVLSIAKQVGYLLRSEPGVRIFFTRLNDRFVTLKERTDQSTVLIRKGFNPVFVSIHGNISLNRKTDGIEVYSLSDFASDEEALTVEMMENAGFSRTDVERTEALAMIVGDLLKDGIRRQSEKMAALVASGMKTRTGSPLRGVKKANFFVLKYNSMPSILIEVGFLSHNRESKMLLNAEYQKKLAAGITDGIRSFLRQHKNSRGFTQ